MKKQKTIKLLLSTVLITTLALLSACGGGGSGSTASTSSSSGSSATGIALPTEVSAVAASTSSGASLASNLKSLARAVSDLPADSDYVTTKPAKYVDEPVLEIFGIIETILKATAQTHYADAENVGSGPYKAVVAWFEESEGQSVKELEEWIVDSQMVNGENQVKVWIDDPEDPVKVTVTISTAPTQNADGDYLDYGEWSILAQLDGGVFFADATVVDGATQLRMSEDFTMTETIGADPVDITERTKAIMIKSPDRGYGKAMVADFGYCWDFDYATETSPCADPSFDGILPQVNVRYAYATDTLALAIDENNDGIVDESVYKDRSDPAEIYYNYGLFNAQTGENVEKSKEFGFPVSYDDGTNLQQGFYGAWQGRHQLWLDAGEGGLPDGATVTEQVWDDSTPRTFTTAVFNGTLTKRSLVPGELSQIQDIPVEIWLSDNFDLKYDSTLNSGNGGWKKCVQEVTGTDAQGFEIWSETCESSAYDMTQLIFSDESRKEAWLNGQFCSIYPPTDPFTQCTYPQVEIQQDGSLQDGNGTPLNPIDGDMLFASVNGSTYVVYNGTQWMEKELTDFDEQNWTPVFAPAENDVPFDFPTGREYYINNKGANFVVKRTASGYDVNMEIQTVVRPDNYDTILSGTDHFAYEWEDASDRSTFVFEPSSMTLQYDEVSSIDSGNGISAGDTLAEGNWGLAAYDASGDKIIDADGRTVQFNWEYAAPGDSWGKSTYLIDNATDEYVLLDDPIMLDPVTIGSIDYSLQFDGWLHGLPDMHWELEKNDYQLDDSIREKIVNIPSGTLVTDALTDQDYYVKPLEIGVVLPTLPAAPAGAPNPAYADGLDLTFEVPTPTDIGTKPTNVETKYVEGKAVQ